MSIIADIDPSTARVLEVVWQAFRENGGWPVYRHVLDRLKNDPTVDTASEIQAWRPDFFMHWRGSQLPYDDDQIGLRIWGLALVGDTSATRIATDAARTLGWMADEERKHVAPADTGARRRVTSEEIAEAVGLHERTLRQLYRIFEMDPHVRGVSGSVDAWSMELHEWVESYRGVRSLEQYLVAQGSLEVAERFAATRASEPTAELAEQLQVSEASAVATSGTLHVDPHPAVARSVRPLEGGDPDLAVREALREIEIRIRDLGRPLGVDPELVGVGLVNATFAAGKPLRDPNVGSGEADGVRALLQGAFGAVRNPTTHRDVGLSHDEGAEWLALASGLHRILDATEVRLTGCSRG